MQQRMRAIVLGMVAVLVLAEAAGAAEGIHEGKWEFTSEMRMEGMPQMPALPPGVTLPPGVSVVARDNAMRSTMVKCVTEDDLVPASDQKIDNKCKTTKMERKGNTLNWRTVCTDKGMQMTGDGFATYTGEVMDSTMTMTIQGQGQTMKQVVKTKGKYLGVCSK